ncbi:related to serine proteinase inhibitor IA-2 [Phialocephala subalpina]|uniref:Related to serine proteinase inhibitor IA-2 n=1 Tax=Phialocephala subalpina TaxID=576137 RepID=A0A1L7WMJ4_9HELO|nr:related to serine proteinase inhibitor IA-2 [Phialocephala subalpina]
MKFAIFTILSFMALALSAQLPQKSIIVSYDDNVPDSVLTQAMDAIKAAGGMITHEYKLIKGFAAKAPAKVLENIQTMGNDFHAVIEEDQMVTIVGGDS